MLPLRCQHSRAIATLWAPHPGSSGSLFWSCHAEETDLDKHLKRFGYKWVFFVWLRFFACLFCFFVCVCSFGKMTILKLKIQIPQVAITKKYATAEWPLTLLAPGAASQHRPSRRQSCETH